ncbi:MULTISPECIES: trans-sulfuration enzyme family protein [unclassified Janthinobacterium]|uniref:trans-sulfuration enzyme family protein n=1 Tax=unclassified Janthinobacterium TaxID=2610881 RepID=UPI00034DD3EA|nr:MULTISPECIES: PLP-dependent aspartate aminotransferase family protein [unclassified Janthinobacterium]MEC5160861.1 cystathionine beta-lyase [Janthinobacterium sp. CG_S6]
MHINTALIHLGRDSAAAANAVNPPLVRASTVAFGTLREFKQSYQGLVFDTPRYGRSGTPTTFELQRAMAKLCGAETCLATASGLAALTAVLSAHAGPKQHLLVSEGVYGPARVFCEEVLAGTGCRVEFFPAQADIGALLRDNTSLVLIETPASLTMEMLDVRAICAAAHARKVPVAADSTWGTPLFFDAHKLGVDISIHAATKYIGGHSDLMLGLITGSLTALAATRAYCDRSGGHAAPDVCWLALRGLRTLGLRMQRHQESAMSLALWLQSHAAVRRVLYPALPSNPGHELWRQQFSGAAGPFTFELNRCDEAQFERFIDGLRLFTLGTSWGGFESLVMPALSHRLRAQEALPDDGRLVRIHVGLEDARDLREDLAQAFEKAAMPSARAG